MFETLLPTVRTARDQARMGTQIALCMALLCLGLVALVSLGAACLARDQTTGRVRAEMGDLATDMAGRLDARMFERYREIQNIAGLEPLRPIWNGDPATIRGVLGKLQASLPEYAWIGFATPDGTVKAATQTMLEGKSVAERPWFQHGLKAATVEDVHDAKLLAQLLGPSPNNEPFRFVDVAVPVHDADGRLAGVLGAHMSWTWAAAIRDTVLETQDPGQKSEIWVLGADGNVLLGPQFGIHPFDAGMIAAIRSSGSLTFTDQSAEPALTAAVLTRGHLSYPGLGWIVVARRPLAAALAPANYLAGAILLIGLAAALIGVALAAHVAIRLTRPLVDLTTRVDLIGRDPSMTMVERSHGSRDIVQLSHSVRSLLRRLGTAETAQEEANRKAAEMTRLMMEKTQRLGEDMRALQVLADTDPLTRLLNRRAFLNYADDAFAHFRRYGRGIGILIIDIDFFKRVNDSHGHATGDEVISSVGAIIAAEARTTDKAARFGGEEFVVLIREADQAGTATLAERIRSAVAEKAISTITDATVSITVSIGAAMGQEGDRDIGDIIARADSALYRAKSAGRDCVVVAEGDPAPEALERAA